MLNVVKRVAKSNTTVLVRGETGTGKELIAGAVHHSSPRAARSFVKVNCAALQENLLESELFGHEKGAFTGADKQRIGRFEQADGGTLFLDEIGDMSPNTQAKILRVLQEHEFERLGGTRTLKVDVRLIAATNRDLPTMVDAGAFREDLFYRLNVVTIEMPPLRERKDDIAALANFFIRRFAGELKKKMDGLSPDALKLLMRYHWPGNIRELENAIERAMLLADGTQIAATDLRLGETSTLGAPRDSQSVVKIPPTGIPLEEVERLALIEALKMSNWVQKDAAELLAISPRVMNYKIKTLGIDFPRGRRAAPVVFENSVSGGAVARRSGAPLASGFRRRPAARARMRAAVGILELRQVHVRVALRGGQLHVAEQLLDGPQVGAVLQQVRRERVPQRVRADAEARAAPGHVARAPAAARCGRSAVSRARSGTPDRRTPREQHGARSLSHAAMASLAAVLNGTRRSLRPLPITRTIRALRFRSSRSRPTSSLSRSPDA